MQEIATSPVVVDKAFANASLRKYSTKFPEDGQVYYVENLIKSELFRRVKRDLARSDDRIDEPLLNKIIAYAEDLCDDDKQYEDDDEQHASFGTPHWVFESCTTTMQEEIGYLLDGKFRASCDAFALCECDVDADTNTVHITDDAKVIENMEVDKFHELFCHAMSEYDMIPSKHCTSPFLKMLCDQDSFKSLVRRLHTHSDPLYLRVLPSAQAYSHIDVFRGMFQRCEKMGTSFLENDDDDDDDDDDDYISICVYRRNENKMGFRSSLEWKKDTFELAVASIDKKETDKNTNYLSAFKFLNEITSKHFATETRTYLSWNPNDKAYSMQFPKDSCIVCLQRRTYVVWDSSVDNRSTNVEFFFSFKNARYIVFPDVKCAHTVLPFVIRTFRAIEKVLRVDKGLTTFDFILHDDKDDRAALQELQKRNSGWTIPKLAAAAEEKHYLCDVCEQTRGFMVIIEGECEHRMRGCLMPTKDMEEQNAALMNTSVVPCEEEHSFFVSYTGSDPDMLHSYTDTPWVFPWKVLDAVDLTMNTTLMKIPFAWKFNVKKEVRNCQIASHCKVYLKDTGDCATYYREHGCATPSPPSLAKVIQALMDNEQNRSLLTLGTNYLHVGDLGMGICMDYPTMPDDDDDGNDDDEDAGADGGAGADGAGADGADDGADGADDADGAGDDDGAEKLSSELGVVDQGFGVLMEEWKNELPSDEAEPEHKKARIDDGDA